VGEVEGFNLACMAELKLSSLETAWKNNDEVSDFGVRLVFADCSEYMG
jgi:hypothetical protein